MEITPNNTFSPPTEISPKSRIIEVMLGVAVVTVSIAVLIIAINYTQKKKEESRE